jgi:hypothetical protein
MSLRKLFSSARDFANRLADRLALRLLHLFVK